MSDVLTSGRLHPVVGRQCALGQCCSGVPRVGGLPIQPLTRSKAKASYALHIIIKIPYILVDTNNVFTTNNIFIKNLRKIEI